jgi:hypothetical protein
MMCDQSEALAALTQVAALVRANVGDVSFKQWLLRQCVAESLFPTRLLRAEAGLADYDLPHDQYTECKPLQFPHVIYSDGVRFPPNE